MFRTLATNRRLGRLLGAAVVGTGLVVSGAGMASANAPDAKSLCAQFILEADRLTQCYKDSNAPVAVCDDYADGFSLQQCLMMAWNVGFGALPGAPDNPGTPRASAPPAPPKVAPKAPTKHKAGKAPTKKKPTNKKR